MYLLLPLSIIKINGGMSVLFFYQDILVFNLKISYKDHTPYRYTHPIQVHSGRIWKTAVSPEMSVLFCIFFLVGVGLTVLHGTEGSVSEKRGETEE